MKRPRERMKEELMVKAEELIDRFLEWEERCPRPTLTEIEEMILKLRKEMGQRMASVVLASQEESTPVPGPLCPECGQEMHYKGKREEVIESRVGPLEIARGYYYCSHCREGFFPPGSPTGAAR